MTKAFVFGKFLPFHKGHQAMISFALTRCDFLSVLVCCDDEETIPPGVRKAWIEATFADIENMEVNVLCYNKSVLPNTSETSVNVSRIWSAEFKKIYPGHQIVITSEPYGELVAGFMGIQHVAFDISKTQVPVSATFIRNNLYAGWAFLPDAVKRYFALKVVILGTESTGKTTLAQLLAAHYNCNLVLEAGRDLIPNSNNITMESLQLVATAHANRIVRAMVGSSPLTIIDTDINITRSYCRFVFNRELPVSDYIDTANNAQLYLYLNHNAPYQQDGTRLSKPGRDLLDASHRETLASRNIAYTELTGNWQDLFNQATIHIDRLIKSKTINL